MGRKFLLLWGMLFSLLVSAVAAPAQDADGNYNIIAPEPKLGHKPQPQPEPWLLPKYQSPRSTRQHVTRAPPRAYVPPRAPEVPPPIYVPQTGRLLPNLPALPGAGPGGAETGQDRAVRCAHQAGVYGQAAGDRNVYINSCISQ